MSIRLTAEMALDAAALAYSGLVPQLPESLTGAGLDAGHQFKLDARSDGDGRFSHSPTGLDMMVLRNDDTMVWDSF